MSNQPIIAITFRDDFRCFKKGDVINFVPGLNILVGDQGSGKSSLLTCLGTGQNYRWSIEVDGDVETRFLDTETGNPRTKQGLRNDSLGLGYQLASIFHSHGEALLPLVMAMGGFQDEVILIDEPEAALSIKSQLKVAQALKKAAKKNQVIVSTHSPYIMRAATQIFDLESRQWVDPNEYITLQETPPQKRAARSK